MTDLEDLLEDIEREIARTDEDNDDCGCACRHLDGPIRKLIEKARANKVIKYPRP